MTRTQRRSGAPVPLAGLFAIGVALLALLAGCAKPMPAVESLSQVKGDNVVLVGRVELVPPLRPGEQHIKLSGPYNDENQYFFMVAKKPTKLASNPIETKYDDIVMAKFGETFYVSNPHRPVYLVAAFLYTSLTRTRIERTWLPGGLKVDIRPGDRAVYIGTLRYHRNEFFDLEKAEIVDDFEREREAFAQKFDNGVPLVKRIMVPTGG